MLEIQSRCIRQKTPRPRKDYGMKMRVVITGATGFIGRALCDKLHSDYEIIALSRNAVRAQQSLGQLARVVQWDGKTLAGWAAQADGALAIINLAGENIASGRWTKSRKHRILWSRLDAAKAIVEAVKQADSKPKVIIQASAVGYYGSRRDEQLDENSPPGQGFPVNVCQEVESFEDKIDNLGVRFVAIRTGLVLGPNGGVLDKLAKPFRFYLGGCLGTGKQWLSWIGLDDEIAAIKFLMENEHLYGVFNLTAPQPVTMKEFSKVLGKVLKKPAWLSVPGFALRLALGEMADKLILSGQRVLPKRLLEAGFQFKHENVESALSAILG